MIFLLIFGGKNVMTLGNTSHPLYVVGQARASFETTIASIAAQMELEAELQRQEIADAKAEIERSRQLRSLVKKNLEEEEKDSAKIDAMMTTFQQGLNVNKGNCEFIHKTLAQIQSFVNN